MARGGKGGGRGRPSARKASPIANRPIRSTPAVSKTKDKSKKGGAE